MKKSKLKTVRFDEETFLQIDELSKRLKVSKSTIIRMMCIRTINEMQDKDGNWIISEGSHKGEDIEAACIDEDDGNNNRQIRYPPG